MEIHYIKLRGEIIPYELHIKNNKHCYIRVKEGKLVVSAASQFSISAIEKLICQHQEYLLQCIRAYQPKVVYEDNGYVYIFGVKYQLVLRDIKEKKCVIHDSSLYVYHRNIEETVEKYLKKILLIYIREYIIYHQNIINRIPEITLRVMKSRWGSCFTTRNKVSFNVKLVHLEKELIEYVIVHELCHFLQANHSPLFYQEIEKQIPDYKQRVKKLKEIGI